MIYGLESFNNDSLKEATIKFIDTVASSFPKIKNRLFYFGFQSEMASRHISENKDINMAHYEIENSLNGENSIKNENVIAYTVRREKEGDDLIVLRDEVFQNLNLSTIKDEAISKNSDYFFHSGLQKTTLEHIIAHELGHVILDDYFETYALEPFVLSVKDRKVSYEPLSEKNKKVIQCINDPDTTNEGRIELLKFRAACILAFYSMMNDSGECGKYSIQSLIINNSIEEWMAESISAYYTGGKMDKYMNCFIKLLQHKEKYN